LQAENCKKIAAFAAAAACLVECRIVKKGLYLLSRLYVLFDEILYFWSVHIASITANPLRKKAKRLRLLLLLLLLATPLKIVKESVLTMSYMFFSMKYFISGAYT